MTPIMDDGEGIRVEYQIPKKIQDRIPDYFYKAFAGGAIQCVRLGTCKRYVLSG